MSAHWHSGIWIRTTLPYISVATVMRSRGISKHLFKDHSTASRFSALQSATKPKGNIRSRTPSRLVDSKVITKAWATLFRWVKEVLSDLEGIQYQRELIYSSSLERGYSTVPSAKFKCTHFCISKVCPPPPPPPHGIPLRELSKNMSDWGVIYEVLALLFLSLQVLWFSGGDCGPCLPIFLEIIRTLVQFFSTFHSIQLRRTIQIVP